MQGGLDAKPVDFSAKLYSLVSCCFIFSHMVVIITPYQLVNENQDLGLGMLCRLDITVNGNSPALVTNNLDVTVEPIDGGSELGTQDEDIDSTEGSKGIECFRDTLVEGGGCRIDD